MIWYENLCVIANIVIVEMPGYIYKPYKSPGVILKQHWWVSVALRQRWSHVWLVWRRVERCVSIIRAVKVVHLHTWMWIQTHSLSPESSLCGVRCLNILKGLCVRTFINHILLQMCEPLVTKVKEWDFLGCLWETIDWFLWEGLWRNKKDVMFTLLRVSRPFSDAWN